MNNLVTEIIRYYNINKKKGIPYEQELKRLNNLDKLTFENLVFPYSYVDKYKNVKVYKDNEGIPYIIINNHNLYFPKIWNDEYTQFIARLIQIEQDPESPHYYLPIPKNSDITLDIGCGEANFTLFNLNSSREFHLFDTSEYKDSIYRTFKNDNNVFFHEGIINEKNIIDCMPINGGKIDNIKIDVEGMEYEILIGARETISNNKPNIQVCVYHYKNQFEEIYNLLKSFGYKNINSSIGYMIYPNSYQEPPYFRKGVIYVSY